MANLTQADLPTWDEWVSEITDGATQTAIGERLGVSRATVGRWSRRVEPNTVMALARAYDANPIEGLMVAGLIKSKDLAGERHVVKSLSTVMLVEELCARFHRSRPHHSMTQ